jgi:glycosyltransferase involved in cell wall biosynthesis
MLWLTSFILEILLISLPFDPKIKRTLATFFFLYVIIVTAFSFPWLGTWFSVVVCVLLPFRLLNIARLIKARMHPYYLTRVVSRTSLVILGMHGLGYLMVWPRTHQYWGLLPALNLLMACLMLILLIFHLRKTRHIPNKTHFSDSELPTVSVCIPARNETDSLEECLKSVLTNDYPKLEILVLDDCSQDRTAEIIKSFAHDGVRFIQGDEPEARWLAKNQAYDKLTREATGELLLFCGVDVRLGSQAIRALVTTMLNRKKSMISVLPLRFYSKASEAFLQPMRYWWELIPPRKLFKRPAVLSTCWLVDREKLKKAGGFKAVSHAIIPEGYFARHFIKTDGYSFIRADEELDIRTAKPFEEQLATAIRTNYPQIRRRPEMALILTLFTMSALIGPFILLPLAIFSFNTPLALISVLTIILLTLTHVLVLQYSDPGNVPLGFINLPVSAFMEIVVGYLSMLKYEFGSVEWKDRNVCIPVMHVIPKREFTRQLSKSESH